MIDSIALGEKVRRDPKITKKRKDEVDEHLDSLTARWDRVKDFMALRKERCVERWHVYWLVPVLTNGSTAFFARVYLDFNNILFKMSSFPFKHCRCRLS